ncbi:type II secretion system F family protein [Lentisphaera profundi]|uniref:Type II secretion system F family protein n=1 Tax=Lentisphaera profundi TaxID=1658616 RepID=A0ABY7VSD6_9BACT|nr:type II secretion system F family protein [Lentisphaera profundi]WDE97110.1 type II secretion system F family protein [Lentisphaera profundi]
MIEFDYIALDSFGENQEGRLEAENFLEASKILKARKWIIRSLDEAQYEVSIFTYLNPMTYFLRSRDFEVAFAQLSTLMSSGVNLSSALKTMSAISLKQAGRTLWKEVYSQVQTGKSLSESLKSHPQIKKSLFANLIKIGEETGELDHLLMTIAVGMERNRIIKSKILTALLYPMFVFIIALIAAGVAVFYLIPKLKVMIAAMGRDLHPATQALIDFADFLQRYSIHFLLLILILAITLISTYLNKNGRVFLDRMTLRVPVIGNMFRVYFSAEFARNFALLIGSGVKLTESLQHCTATIWNTYLKNVLKRARNNIINGAPLTETLSCRYAFSPLLISMVSVGEKTGSIDNLLEDQAKYHYEILDKYINQFSALISFVMILLVAGTIAFVFAAILLTYFS